MNKTMKEFINFKSLEKNSVKIGFHLQEVDPRFNKYLEGVNSDLIKTDIIKSKLKEKLKEYEIKTNKKSLKQKELEEALKNSSLKNIKKPIIVNKAYKMEQYEKL